MVDMTKALHVQNSLLNIVLKVLQNRDQGGEHCVYNFIWSYSN